MSGGDEACFRKRKTTLEVEYENYEKASGVGGFLLTVDVGGGFKQMSVAKSSFEGSEVIEWPKILQGPIFCIAISTQLGAIYVSTGNGFMYEIDIDSQKIKRNWGKIHERSIYCMALTHGTRRLFTGGIDKELKEWDLEKRVLARNWGVWQTNSILKMTVTIDDRFIYTAGADLHLLKIAIKNPEDDSLDYGIVHRNVITCMQITQNGLILATCSNHSDIKLWSVSSDEIFLVIPRGTSYNISSIMLTPDSQGLISGDEGGVLKIWEINSGVLVKNFGQVYPRVGKKSDVRSGVVKQMAISRDGRFLFTLNEKNSILQWDLLLNGLFRDLGSFFDKEVIGVGVIS
jgi:WD40 repeat protein